MLLRGDRVSKAADNVSPAEPPCMIQLVQRQNEPPRARPHKDPYRYLMP
jgi:hypothetical protein